MKKGKKEVYAFGKIRDTVKYRLKFAHFPYLEEVLTRETPPLSEDLVILDVGCGPGNIPAFCGAGPGRKWYGLDLWEHQLRQAAEKSVYENLFQVNLLDGLPFRDESFDIVICSEVLMYLPNANAVLAEFHRALRPGGKIFLYNPVSLLPKTFASARRWFRRIHQEKDSVALDTQREWKNARRPCRINYYSLRSLIEDVGSADFMITEVTAFRLFRNRIRFLTRLENYRWYYRLTRFFATRYPHLASDVMVVGRKKEKEPPDTSSMNNPAAA
ncbi:MAG: class I SAM-dependent methyltransferase [Deltaproteobacteria bacterium]